MFKRWEKIPKDMQTKEVYEYYKILYKKRHTILLKRIFDIFVSFAMIIMLFPILIAVAIVIKFDSKGSILYKQERVTQYGKVFKVYKFRTMINGADKVGSHVTVDDDPRITRIGKKIRNARIDELPQLFNVLIGNMSFVGTRPEATRYVAAYTDEMKATLLLPAGVTSEASILFKDEAEMLRNVENVDKEYIEKVLPEKMKYNLESLKHFSFINDIKTMIRTVFAVLK